MTTSAEPVRVHRPPEDRPGGTMPIVHSALSDVDKSLEVLTVQGLAAEVDQHARMAELVVARAVR